MRAVQSFLPLKRSRAFDVAETVGRKRTIGKHARRQANVLFAQSLADRAAPEAIDLHFGFVAREFCRRVGIGRFVGPGQPRKPAAAGTQQCDPNERAEVTVQAHRSSVPLRVLLPPSLVKPRLAPLPVSRDR